MQVWSDPAPNDDDIGILTSGRDWNAGGIVRFGADRVEEFCKVRPGPWDRLGLREGVGRDYDWILWGFAGVHTSDRWRWAHRV